MRVFWLRLLLLPFPLGLGWAATRYIRGALAAGLGFKKFAPGKDHPPGKGSGLVRSLLFLLTNIVPSVALLFPLFLTGIAPLPVHTPAGHLQSVYVISGACAGCLALGATFLLFYDAVALLAARCCSSICTRKGYFRAFALIAWMVCGTLVGIKNTMLSDPAVVRRDIPVVNLSPEAEGFRILMIADLHIGSSVGRRNVQTAIDLSRRACDASGCDVVCLVGDIIDADLEDIKVAAALLQELTTIAPTFFVFGNHEHLHGAIDEVATFLARIGIRVLKNDRVDIPGKAVTIAGVYDLIGRGEWRQDVGKALLRGTVPPPRDLKAAEATKTTTTILLAHQPNAARAIETDDRVDVMLSGHVHAGQFFPSSIIGWMVNKYFVGVYRGTPAVFVSPGTNQWGPPLRFLVNPREISLLTLVRDQVAL